MGMFDYVKCERDLPDGLDGRGVEFQTKDFDCGMNTLVITDDGDLIEQAWVWDGIVPKEERPYPDAPEGSFEAMIGSMRSRQLPPEKIEFHGFMRFYASRSDLWNEYKAKFTDGKLVEIVAVKRGE
jgi:hypothetical protein